MKKILVVLAFAALMLPLSVCRAQQDPVVIEINGEKITQSQFMKEFLYSQGKVTMGQDKLSEEERRKALDEYVDLFVNYRVKLADAYAKGFDTIGALNAELKQYRDELAAPYLIDSATMQHILREAYERNAYAVHAAHILIRVGEAALPEDTLKAYNMAMEYYNRAAAGEDFYKLAQEAKDAQSQRLAGEKIKINPMEGDLGCFTVFDMIYPFENAAYTIEPGTVGKPIRTKFGYHVIKVFERVPYYGKTKLKHIWAYDANYPERAEARARMAWQGLQEGQSWDAMVRQHSNDRNNNQKGGDLPVLSLRQMPADYVVRISKGMKEGEISEPFQTRYGWHVIWVEDLDTLPPFEEMLPFYKQRLSRDQRSTNPREIYAKNAMQRYNFVDYTKEKVKNKWGRPTKKWMASLDEVKSLVTDSVFWATWTFDSAKVMDLRPLFQLVDVTYNGLDFCKYIAQTQKRSRVYNLDMFVEQKYDEFIEAKAIEYADAHLEEENKEFADLIEEYRHGLMIFSYNDKMVWSKAIYDSVGFANFYEVDKKQHNFANPEDAPYFWNERARVSMLTIADSALLDFDKAIKMVNKCVKKHMSVTEIQNKLKRAMGKENKDQEIAVDLMLAEKGKQELLSEKEWKVGVYTQPADKGYQILIVDEIIAPTLKTLDEARGYYLNAYQNEVERQLINDLRKKYGVKIYRDVVNKIAY